jgi:DNA topoisomerase-2
VEEIGEKKYLIRGCYEKIGEDKIRITELPVGTWTMNYKSFLESLADGVVDKDGKRAAPLLKDVVDSSTEVMVDFVVTFPKGKFNELDSMDGDANGIGAVEKMLKLTTTVSTTNMHLFDADCKLHKYANVEEIIADFYKVRYTMYEKRKAAQIALMQRKLQKLSNRAKYIQYVLTDKIDLRRKKSAEIDALLEKFGFDRLGDGSDDDVVSYKYLVKMPMDSVCQENVDRIMKEKVDTETELTELIATGVEKIWLNELAVFEKEYNLYKKKREKIQLGGLVKPTSNPVGKKIKKK